MGKRPRIIDFRFFDTVTKQMIYRDTNAKLFDACEAMDETTLMQYTGLKDANGQKIWEGDIVRGKWKGSLPSMIVLYQAPAFVMKTNKRNKTWSTFDIHPDDNQIYIVIGNIYENPELLSAYAQRRHN